MADLPLSAEQEAEAQRLFASKSTTHLLGKTEFELRDAVHQLGAQMLQTALDERKKGASKAPA